MSIEDRWKTLEQVLEEKNGEERECGWCHEIKKGLWWGGIEWVCGRCMEDSTIEGMIVGDRLVPRFTQEYQRLRQKEIDEYQSDVVKSVA